MIHEMNLHPAPFAHILGGVKDVEMRLHDPRRQGIRKGDTIVFTNRETGDTITCLVVEKHIFPSFYELYAAFDKERIGYLPDEVANPDDMELYYSKEDIATWGVCGIEIKLQET